jgi:DNA recombination protein RmuC
MEIVLLLVGLIAGGLAGWFAMQSKFSGATEKAKILQQQLNELKLELERERRTVLDARRDLATTEADYRNLQEKLTDQKRDLENLQEKFTVQFKNLANEIFEEKSKKFTDQNKSNLFDLLKPLGEKIVDFERKVEETHKDSISRTTRGYRFESKLNSIQCFRQ